MSSSSGVSPINRQNRDLIVALERELASHGIALPVFFGNRNWSPTWPRRSRRCRRPGCGGRSPSSPPRSAPIPGCRQYRENIFEAQLATGADAPEMLKLRCFYNHPGFVEANADARARRRSRSCPPSSARARRSSSRPTDPGRDGRAVPLRRPVRRDRAARRRGGRARRATRSPTRAASGPPQVPWLEPDVCDRLRELHAAGASAVVVSPRRVPLRPHGGALRPRPRGGRGRRRARAHPGTRGHRRHPPRLRGDDPGARRRSDWPAPSAVRSAASDRATTSARRAAASAGNGRPSPWEETATR